MLLYISDRLEQAKAIIKILSQKNAFVLHGTLDVACFLCDKKETGGIVLDCVPRLAQGEAVCAALRKAYPALPIAMIVSDHDRPMAAADLILRDSLTAEEQVNALLRFFWEVCEHRVERLSTYALTVECDPCKAYYMGYELPLTPTEHRILHCLLYRAPLATDIEDLLALCFPARVVTPSNLHVHIHHINQKATRIHTAPLVVRAEQGYRLRDGIL